MNRVKRDTDYPVDLEAQFILRMPEQPASVVRELIKSGENFKNRLSIHIFDDMRHGEVRLDHWLLYGKIVDLPTIVESWKSIDRKSLYKCADISQMMICKEELEPIPEESPLPTKNKNTHKVDKKYLWAHGITPPTKNVRKRRFRKTLRKKSAEAPEIEKEVKRLLRADNEAVSVTWEVVEEEDNPKKETASPAPQKSKVKREPKASKVVVNQTSKVEDIFGGALSDSDDENVNIDNQDAGLTENYDDFNTDLDSIDWSDTNKELIPATKLKSDIRKDCFMGESSRSNEASIKGHSGGSNDLSGVLQNLVTELEELKQRRHRTQLEIAGMANMTLKQRFQEILQSLNKEILLKEIEYNKIKLQ